MRRARLLSLAFLAFAASGSALHAQHAEQNMAAFDGTWDLVFETQMGGSEWTVQLEVADHVISGVAVTEMGNMPIEGMQDGNEVEFILYLNAPDHAVEFEFSGTLDGDAAEGSVLIVDEMFAWTAQRADAR